MNHNEEQSEISFVSRGGIKLQHALKEFNLSVRDLTCADFGCSVGGFTDCLLQNGAIRVYAVDTAYGILDYRLRIDDRVTVMERTNVLYGDPPLDNSVDLIVIDAGWTTQARVLPVALKWLRGHGHILTLIKPHYELTNMTPPEQNTLLPEDAHPMKGILDDDLAAKVCDQIVININNLDDIEILRVTKSPIRGGGKRGGKRSKRKGAGNVEYLALLRCGK